MLEASIAFAVASALALALWLSRRDRLRASSGIPSPSAVLSKHPAAAARFSDGEMVVALSGQAEGLALNAVAARCWELIDGSRSVIEIARTVSAEYGAPLSEGLREVQSFGRQVKRALLAMEGSEWELVHFHTHDLFAFGIPPEREAGLIERRLGESLILHAAACLAAHGGPIEPWRGGRRERRTALAAMRAHRKDEAPLEEAARRFQSGWEACAAGRLSEAERSYRSAFEKAPGWANPHYQLGYVLLLQKRYREAIESLEKADALSPGFFMVREYLEQARALLSGRLSHEAFVLFDRANAAGLSDPDAAIRLARRALELTPQYPPAHLVIGRAYQKKALLDEALAELGRAIRMNPDRATLCHALLSRGSIFMAQGRAQEAMREWEKVLEIDGSASATRSALATMAASSTAH